MTATMHSDTFKNNSNRTGKGGEGGSFKNLHRLPENQRTTAEMIARMKPISFTQSSRDRHVRRWFEAHEHMRRADTERVMSFTGLKSPFAKRAA